MNMGEFRVSPLQRDEGEPGVSRIWDSTDPPLPLSPLKGGDPEHPQPRGEIIEAELNYLLKYFFI